MADTLINWHRAACTCEGEDRCIHCQTVAALVVKGELVAALAHLIEFCDRTGQGVAKQQEDARAILAKATAA